MPTMLSGRKLKVAIEAANLTQAEFARRMHTSPQVISKYILNGTTNAGVNTLHKMMCVLGCNESDLLVITKK